ncbi:MAG: inosine monophosphate cyclohydrolase [Ruminococcaceae bacterium]|nr:inosine monophosphate cyclohydrolase [Oscillospiraceae bacterium]
MGARLHGNEYVGRGIVIGKTEDGTKAAVAYFIMGRSENSRNRIFKKEGDNLMIYPFDESKVKDPSLIIYPPILVDGKKTIVTNGDQTKTIYDLLQKNKVRHRTENQTEKGIGNQTESYVENQTEKDTENQIENKCRRAFENALATRRFEPDAPNLTPRISGLIDLEDGFSYKLNILKSADVEGSACNRYTFEYEPLSGLGHFIHTYVCDGNPLPTFQGEPERVVIPDNIDEFYEDIWNNLDANNRISLYVRYIDLKTGEYDDRLINKNR